MQIFENDQLRFLTGTIEQEPRHSVEQPEAEALRVGLIRNRPRRGGGDLREVSAGGAHDLNPRPVRRGTAFLPAPPCVDGAAARSRRLRHLLQQPRLADSSLTRDSDDGAAPGLGFLEGMPQLGDLPAPADKRTRRAGTERLTR